MPADRPAVALDGDTPAGIIYTSGTTGASKGAVLTHNNFAANAINLLACWQITAADRFLLALPLFHVHALGNGLHCWLASGCRMRLLERFEHPKPPPPSSISAPRSSSACPPSTSACSTSRAETARDIGAAMRLFVSGSAPAARPSPGRLPRALRPHHPGALRHERKPHEHQQSVRRRAPPRQRRPAAARSLRAPRCDGEIQLKGPNLFAGYWRRDEATRAAFVDGWFRTGDLADCSPDGYYTLCGRKSDLIISGGFNIYPREIEEFLQEQPEVAEAAVVGVPDPVRGEVPVAYIVCRAPVDPAELEARCRDKLASFKVPRAFKIVDSLPRNAMGKIQKHLLPR